jgi:hypothetical protein
MTNPYMRDGTAKPHPNSAALAANYADAVNALMLATARQAGQPVTAPRSALPSPVPIGVQAGGVAQ